MNPKALRRWTELAGDERARAAAALVDTFGRQAILPNALVEVFLRARGMRYKRDDSVNGVPVDFTVEAGGGLAAWRIWESRAAMVVGRAADARIQGAVARGLPVMRVIHLMADDIYSSDGELEKARVGHG